ncbi:gp45 family putative tail fiber system protein [Listeria booriae]
MKRGLKTITNWKKRTFKRKRKTGDSTIILNYLTGTVNFSELSSEVPLIATGYHTFQKYVEYLESQGYKEVKECFQL